MSKLVGGVTGKGWMPGRSGNPSGTIKNTPKLKTALLKFLRTPVGQRLVIRTRSDLIAARLIQLTGSRDERVARDAIRDVFEWTEKKPAQELEITEQRTRIVVELGLVRDADADRADYRIEALDGNAAPAGLLEQ